MFLNNLMHGLVHPAATVSSSNTNSNVDGDITDRLSTSVLTSEQPATGGGLISQEFINSLHKMPSAASLAQLKAHLCMREHLNHDECDRALLPTLEHASLVHSHIHHPETETLHDTYDQTRNAIVYISLVVVVYVMVVLWLVSANFRNPQSSQSTITRARHFFGQLMSGSVSSNTSDGEDVADFSDDFCGDGGEMEALIVVRDRGGKGAPTSTTSLVPEDEDGEHV